jgi:O-antigen/teichoic acid export membrane protein
MLINTTLTTLSKKFNIDLHYFAKGGFWLSLAQVIAIIGALSVSVVFANTLAEEDYGVYRYLIGIGALLTSFSLTGMSQSILQAAAKKYVGFFNYGIKVSHIYSIGIVFAGFIGSIYYFYNENQVLALGCIIIAVFQPLLNTYQQISSYLTGNKQFRESTIFQVIKTIFVTFICIGTILITQNVLVLLLAYVTSHTLAHFFGYIYFRPREEGILTEEVRKKYLQYSKSTSLRNIISNIAYRLDTIIVFQQLGAAELAMYTIANMLPEQIKGSFKNLVALLVPKYVLHENIESIKKSVPRRSFQLFLLLSGITLLYVLLAPFVYQLLFPKYESAVFLSQIVALSFPAMTALIPLSALQAHTEEKKLNSLNTQISILTIILTLGLTLSHGLIGAICARVISRYINLVLSYYHFFIKKF